MTIEFIQRNRSGVLAFVFSLISILFLTLRVDAYIIGIKTAVWFLVSPEVVYSGLFFNKLDALEGRIFKLVRAEGANYILTKENELLAKAKIERDALEAENNRLRVLLNLKKVFFPAAISAQVIGRDVREWFHVVSLNKGKADGVVFSAAVVTGMTDHPALIGRIIEVGERTSKVLLVTDEMSAVSAEVAGKGDLGLIEGQARPWVSLNYLPPASQASVGDQVITAGLGGVFPPGVPIGQVVSLSDMSDGYFKGAKIRLDASLGSLRDVLVLRREEISDSEAKP